MTVYNDSKTTTTGCQLRFHISALNIQHFCIICPVHQYCAVDRLGFEMSSVTSGKLDDDF